MSQEARRIARGDQDRRSRFIGWGRRTRSSRHTIWVIASLVQLRPLLEDLNPDADVNAESNEYRSPDRSVVKVDTKRGPFIVNPAPEL